MYATYAATCTTPKQVTPIAAFSQAQLLKTSPKTGYAPSVASVKTSSVLLRTNVFS